MAKVGIFCGSTLGATKQVADDLAGILGGTVHDAASAGSADFEGCDVLLLGSSTWGYGELQDDWVSCIDELGKADLSGKKVALFGFGDQEGYADTFVDALGIIYDKAVEKGATPVGAWPTDGYSYSDSKAVRDGKFVGLPLDDNNQGDQTEDRVKKWANQVKSEAGI